MYQGKTKCEETRRQRFERRILSKELVYLATAAADEVPLLLELDEAAAPLLLEEVDAEAAF